MKYPWSNLFEPHILARGMDYWNRGKVTVQQTQENFISAVVSGSDDYVVEIQLKDGEPAELYCDCPYATGGYHCKHMAAVLYTHELGPVDKNQDDTEGQWEQLLDQLSEDALRKLVHDLASRDALLQERIRRMASAPCANRDLWVLDLERMVSKLADRHGYLDYNDAYELMLDFTTYLEDQLPSFLESRQIMEAVDLIGTVYGTAFEQDMDDSAGGLTHLMYCCHSAWNMTLSLADADMETRIYRYLHNLLECSDWQYGNDDLEDYFLSADWSMALKKQNLQWIDSQIESCDSNYRTSYLLNKRVELMTELGAAEKEVLNYWKSKCDFPAARDHLIEIYEQEDPVAAIDLVLLSREAVRGAVWRELPYTKKLIDLYLRTNQFELYEQELNYLIFHCKCLDVPYIHKLKDITLENQWPAVLEQLFQLSPDPGTKLSLLNFEGMFPELLASIHQLGRLDLLLNYEDSLKAWSSEQTMRVFADLLDRMMYHSCDRNMYRRTISYLKELKTYPNGSDTVAKLLELWCTRHRNRPAMKDELRKAGYRNIH